MTNKEKEAVQFIMYKMDEFKTFLGSFEQISLKQVDEMCAQSLDPELFEKWEDVKKQLVITRHNLNE